MKIVTRQEAIASGQTWYFTGVPCKRGHVAKRLVGGGCRECNAPKVRAWKKANMDKVRRWTAEYRERNAEKVKERNRLRARKIAGLPEPTRECPATCEACGRPPGARALSLDHCHKTGKFRGWLCFLCNSGLGKLGDNLEAVERMAAYLRRAAQ